MPWLASESNVLNVHSRFKFQGVRPRDRPVHHEPRLRVRRRALLLKFRRRHELRHNPLRPHVARETCSTRSDLKLNSIIQGQAARTAKRQCNRVRSYACSAGLTKNSAGR
jgi:hypothetical protein